MSFRAANAWLPVSIQSSTTSTRSLAENRCPLKGKLRFVATPVHCRTRCHLRAGMDRATLADRHEPDTESDCDRCAENEPASLDARNLGYFPGIERYGQSLSRLL